MTDISNQTPSCATGRSCCSGSRACRSRSSYQMLIVAVGWQLYALTGDPFDLGLVGLIQFIPAMLLFLVVGQVTDRYDRALLLIACQIDRGGRGRDAARRRAHRRDLARPDPRRAFILGIARAFEVTVMQIIVPSLVPLPLVPRAVAALGDRQPDRDHRRAGARRISLRGGPGGGVRRLPRAVRRRGAAHAADPDRARGAVARAADAARPSSRASPSSAAVRRSSASSRSTCSRCCSAA